LKKPADTTAPVKGPSMHPPKKTIKDLALYGGDPLFREKLHVGRPNIGNRDVLLQRINQALDRKWFSNAGPFVQEFEAAIAKYCGVKHCMAMCNATVALILGKQGSRYLISATVMCALFQGTTKTKILDQKLFDDDIVSKFLFAKEPMHFILNAIWKLPFDALNR
jgi:hypothetical protein